MYIDFSKLFHRASKDIGITDTPADTSQFYKTYELLPVHTLSRKAPERNPSLFVSITERESGEAFVPAPITNEELSTLLLYSCGEVVQNESVTKRAQPSAGHKYPVEAYVLVFRPMNDLPAGVYHYNVRDHTLECISAREFTKADISQLFADSWAQDVACAIILTGVFSRTMTKYAQRGYRYTLLEAGHIGQNVYLVSQALNLQCFGVGGSHDVALEELLDIDGEYESVLYTLVVGK